MKQYKLTYKKLHYVMSVPDDFDEGKKYPTLLFLHGAGGRGNDINQLATNPYFVMTAKHELPIVTFAPQCYADTWFDIFEQLQDFAEFVLEQSYVEPCRYYLMGASMGGFGTWQLATTMAGKFAAIIPICGGGMEWNTARLSTTPVWAFHGSDDSVVEPKHSIDMVNSVNNNGGNAKLTIFEGVRHNSWEPVYNDIEVFNWMLSQAINNGEIKTSDYNNSKDFG